MDWFIYAILFICGLALYVYAYRQGQKDERRVVQAWLDNIVVRHEGEWKTLSGRANGQGSAPRPESAKKRAT